MLFRDTENPLENRFFGPGFLRLSVWRTGYTENSCFPYTRFLAMNHRGFLSQSGPNTRLCKTQPNDPQRS